MDNFMSSINNFVYEYLLQPKTFLLLSMMFLGMFMYVVFVARD